MEKKERSYLVKAQNYFDAENVKVVGSYSTKEKAKTAADNYEKTIPTKRYKKEFCVYQESDGIHKGWFFTIF